MHALTLTDPESKAVFDRLRPYQSSAHPAETLKNLCASDGKIDGRRTLALQLRQDVIVQSWRLDAGRLGPPASGERRARIALKAGRCSVHPLACLSGDRWTGFPL